MRKRHCEEELSFIPKWPLLAMRPRIISVAEVVVVGGASGEKAVGEDVGPSRPRVVPLAAAALVPSWRSRLTMPSLGRLWGVGEVHQDDIGASSGPETGT